MTADQTPAPIVFKYSYSFKNGKNFMRAILVTLLAAVLCSCSNEPDLEEKPNLEQLTVIGTIDEDKYVDTEALYEMSEQDLRDKYLGKEISIYWLTDGIKSGGYQAEKGQCTVVLSSNGELRKSPYQPDRKSANVKFYANHFPDSVIDDAISDNWKAEDISYDKEIKLPKSVCNVCEWNPQDKTSCFYNSPNTVLSGKVIAAGRDDVAPYLFMRLKGVAF